MSTPPDDAQRDMEQRALRNVRALVDKYENKDVLDRKSLRTQIIVIVAVILALAVVAFAVFKLTAKDEPTKTLILPPPAKSAPK